MDATKRDAIDASEPVGVAVIGAGAIAQAHLYGFQRSAQARLVAVADVDEARAKAAAERFGVGLAYRDYQDVLARDDVQAVSICTPPFTHVEMATAALRAGKHVLCEKPVTSTLAGLDAIAEAVRASGSVFSVVFQLRFGRGAQQVRLLLDEGRFGRLHLGLAETLWFRDHSYYDDVGWRGTWAHECGGVTSSLAVHLIDCLLWFMGEPVSVYAEAGTFRARIEQDDSSAAVIRFRSGAIGQITSTVSSFDQERSRLELYGTELTAVFRGPVYDSTTDFVLSSPDPSHAAALRQEMDGRIPSGHAILHQGAIADFLDAIREGRPPLAGVDACAAALQVTTGIYKSAMTGQPMNLPIRRDDPFYNSLPPEGFALPGGAG